MARPWRDILHYSEYAALLQRDISPQNRAISFELKSGTSLGIGRVGVKTTTFGDYVDGLLEEIKQYHLTDKRAVNMLLPRAERLKKISKHADYYFTKVGQDRQAAQNRGTRGKFGSSPLVYSFGRNMLTLFRRSLRKAGYLERLNEYCRNHDPQALIRLITAPQHKTDTELGLHVKMEAEDFEHRDGYEDGALADAYEAWSGDNRYNSTVPFFVWLEGHNLCTSQDKSDADIRNTTKVEYVSHGPGSLASTTSKLRILDVAQNPIHAINMTLAGAQSQPLATTDTDYQASRAKAIDTVNNNWATGVACFVWSRRNQLYIAEHEPGKFHHSSFLSGGNVKCAGMLRIVGGVITEVSNDSGHYKPGKLHMRSFLTWLNQNNAVTANTQVRVATGGGQGWSGTYQQFQGLSGRFFAGGGFGRFGH